MILASLSLSLAKKPYLLHQKVITMTLGIILEPESGFPPVAKAGHGLLSQIRVMLWCYLPAPVVDTQVRIFSRES